MIDFSPYIQSEWSWIVLFVMARFDLYMKENGQNANRVTVQLGLSVDSIGKSRKKDATSRKLAYCAKHCPDKHA